ncbi:MAG TPA: hypothetical protein VFE90_14070 [Myxococcales bacterium]|jgi:hypothetical protein|nr:hypothetical protein [Myxococcales bacterium]
MGFAGLAARIPEWGRLFDEPGYAAFHQAVRDELLARGESFELHDDHVRLGSWELPLLPLAHRCAGAPRADWRLRVRDELDRRIAEEKLGSELDAVRGDFAKARPVLKLRVQRKDSLGPGAISAAIAGDLHAVLVLDLPSFVTPVRAADLSAWERPAPELVSLALQNVREQERVELNPIEIASARIFAISGRSVFVATLALAADELLGADTAYGALVAMPSAHILLLHSIADARSLRVLPAMAAGALQAFESGPAPLSPDLFWKRADRFVALPVRRENGEVKCELPREFDEQVASRLS